MEGGDRCARHVLGQRMNCPLIFKSLKVQVSLGIDVFFKDYRHFDTVFYQ